MRNADFHVWDKAMSKPSCLLVRLETTCRWRQGFFENISPTILYKNDKRGCFRLNDIWNRRRLHFFQGAQK